MFEMIEALIRAIQIRKKKPLFIGVLLVLVILVSILLLY